MRRLLAVLGALAMVGTAVVIRNAIDDDDGGGAGDGGIVVLCARDLGAACDALGEVDGVDVQVADAADTARLLEAGDVPGDVDAWLTSSAWTEVLASRAPAALDETTVLANTPVVLAADPDRSAALGQLCAGTRLLRCLGDHAGAAWSGLGGEPGWGTLKTGLPDADSAAGLAVLASTAVGFFGDREFAANDFTAGEFPGWLSGLAAPSAAGDTDPIGTLVTQKGRYSAAAGTEARLRQVTRPVDRLDIDPDTTITAVIIALPGGDGVPGIGAAREALVAAGWAAAEGAVDPLLKPGVLAALHTLWTETIR